MALVLCLVAIVAHGKSNASGVGVANRHRSQFVRHRMFRKCEKDDGEEDDQERDGVDAEKHCRATHGEGTSQV